MRRTTSNVSASGRCRCCRRRPSPRTHARPPPPHPPQPHPPPLALSNFTSTCSPLPLPSLFFSTLHPFERAFRAPFGPPITTSTLTHLVGKTRHYHRTYTQ